MKDSTLAVDEDQVDDHLVNNDDLVDDNGVDDDDGVDDGRRGKPVPRDC